MKQKKAIEPTQEGESGLKWDPIETFGLSNQIVP